MKSCLSPAMDSPLAMKNRQKNLPVLRLLIMECIDGVQSRRFLGRVKAKDQANENGEKERTYNGGHREEGVEGGDERYDFGYADTKKNTYQASGYADGHRFDKELYNNHVVCGTQGLSYTDFPGPFRDGHQHDIHNADAPYQKGDGCNASEEYGQGLGSGFHGFHKILGVLDGEIVFFPCLDAMTGAEKVSHVGLDLGEVIGIVRGNDNVVHIGNVHHSFLHGGKGNEDPVILVHERIAFFLQFSDDSEWIAVDADLLSDRRFLAEKAGGYGLADDAHPGPGIVFLIRPEPAFGHRKTGQGGIVLSAAIDTGGPVLISIHHQVACIDQGSGVGNIGQVPDGQVILVGQGLHRACSRTDARFSPGAGSYGNGIGTQGGNIIFNVALHSVADGHKGNNGGYADDNAQHGEEGAHFVAQNRAPGHKDAFNVNVCHGRGPLISLLIWPSDKITCRPA